MEEKKIKLGIPKGSLQNYTLKIFKTAGFDIEIPERGYFLKIDDPEIDLYLLRPQEIPKYVEKGKLDAGITGEDVIFESKTKVIKIVELKYGKQKLGQWKQCLMAPKDSKIKSVKDLQGKTISTELVNVVKDYLKKNKVKAKVEFSWGATEVKPPKFADAIVDLVEAGAFFRDHNLKIIAIILESPTVLVIGRKIWQDKWKKEKIKALALLLQGAVRGAEEVNLMMHIPERKLKKILKALPKLKLSTIKKIAGENWYGVTIRCQEKETRELIPKLKRLGCQGIVEWPLVKLVL